MSHLTIALLCLAGFGGLALSTQRQQEELTGRAWPTVRTRTLRASGWIALVSALGVAVASGDWSLGLVSYAGHTSLAAGTVTGLLILARRLRRPGAAGMR
ncbi:MAG: DUF3325 domain-containing protein [Rhizobacter sp.]|jgi:hypothetical protein